MSVGASAAKPLPYPLPEYYKTSNSRHSADNSVGETARCEAFMKTIAIDLDMRVFVRVREAGQTLYNRYLRQLGTYPATLAVDSEGYTEFTLRQVAQIFGPGLGAGADAPIEAGIKLVTE